MGPARAGFVPGGAGLGWLRIGGRPFRDPQMVLDYLHVPFLDPHLVLGKPLFPGRSETRPG